MKMWGSWCGRMEFMSGRKQIGSLHSLFLVLPRVVVGIFAKPIISITGRPCQVLLNVRNIRVLQGAESSGGSSSTYPSL